MNFSLYEIVWMFFLYAFLGWCTEVAYAAVRRGKFVNRGFLNGPVCPIYGFGLVIVIGLLAPLSDRLLLLFLGSVILTSALEFITGWALEKLFHAKWWDYSQNKFNIKGYVCLEFSLVWGLAATFIVRIIHPMIYGLITKFPRLPGHILLYVFLAMILADLAATLVAIRHLQSRLKLLMSLAQEIHETSDRIGDSISGTVLNIKEYAEDVQDRYGELAEMKKAHRAEEKELQEAHQEQERQLLASIWEKAQLRQEEERNNERLHLQMLENQLRMKLEEKKKNRILRAFPDLKSNRYQEALEKLRGMDKKQ
ncbi:MAG: hypothetical protein GXW99_07400 [Clostridiales bacterium]|nr:hypothetical protein [Clostridiales bacterium]